MEPGTRQHTAVCVFSMLISLYVRVPSAITLLSFLAPLHCLSSFINHFAGNCKCLPICCAQCDSVYSHQLLLHLGQGHEVCFCAGKSAVSELLHPSHHHCKLTPKYMCVHVCLCICVCVFRMLRINLSQTICLYHNQYSKQLKILKYK